VSAIDPSAQSLPIVGSGGASLPDTPANVLLDAANAGDLVALAPSTGVGSTIAIEDAVSTGVGILTESAAEGDFVVGDGAGGTQLASVDAAAVRAVIGAAVSVTTTTYYASDGTAANGAGVDATASVSGSGSGSTVAFAVSSTQRLLNSSGIACGSWVSPAIPQTARKITLYVRSTAVSGMTTSGFRFAQFSLRRSGENPPASLLLGASANDANSYFSGNNRSNSNAPGYSLGSRANSSPLNGTDRWLRIVWTLDQGPRVWIATGDTTGSSRPTSWTPVNTDAQSQATTGTLIGSMGSGNVQVIVGVESYGTGGASTLSLSLVVEVET
jgi:hypothetical protein